MDAQIIFVFKVGHSVYKKSKPAPNRTHHWRFHVESWSKRYPLSAFVDRITFKLHDTFANPTQVVSKEPFAIEEDGFGTFGLQAEVSFLDHLVTLNYDITLYDHRELYAFRSVRIDPGNSRDSWAKFVDLGGIPIPRSVTHKEVCQQILRRIQTPDGSNLTPTSFYPSLSEMPPLVPQLRSRSQRVLGLASASQAVPGLMDSPASENHNSSPSQSATVGTAPAATSRSRLSREARSQALANLGFTNSASSSPGAFLLAPVAGASSSASSISHAATIKHKKKLQLQHEAQLRWENRAVVVPQASTGGPPLPPLSATAALQSASPPKERIVLKLSIKGDAAADPVGDRVGGCYSSASNRQKKEKHKKQKREKHKEKRHANKHKQRVSDVWTPSETSQERPGSSLLGVSHPPSPIETGHLQASPLLPHPPPPVIAASKPPPLGPGSASAVDPQLATMVWISHLNGGPQPLVSPLPPPPSSSPPPHPPAVSADYKPQPAATVVSERDASETRRRTDHRFPERPSSRLSSPHQNSSFNNPSGGADFSTKTSSKLHGGESSRQPKKARERRQEAEKKCILFEELPLATLSSSSYTSSSPFSDSSTPPMSIEARPNGDEPAVVATAGPVANDNNSNDDDDCSGACLDDAALGELFRRLCCLENEHMAYKMACVLKRYTGGVEVLTPAGASSEHPQIISFDLRRLPLECLVQMTEIIVADERLAEEAAANAAKRTARGKKSKSPNSSSWSGTLKARKQGKIV